jgi:integrase
MGKDLVVLDNDPELLSLAVLPPPKALDRNPAAVYLASLPSPESRRTLGATLEGLAGLLSGGTASAARIPWGAVRYAHTAALRAALLQRYRPATVNKYLATLRGVLKSAVRLGLMDLAAYQAATDFKGVKGETLPRGRALAPGELRALVRACLEGFGPGGARDAAVLALLYGCGLRRAEAVGLELADVDLDGGVVTVHGKGRKDRTAHIPPRREPRSGPVDGDAGPGSRPPPLPRGQGRAPHDPAHDRPSPLSHLAEAGHGSGRGRVLPARFAEDVCERFGVTPPNGNLCTLRIPFLKRPPRMPQV